MTGEINVRREYYLAKIRDAEVFQAEARDVRAAQMFARIIEGYQTVLQKFVSDEPP
jgi:hypothetical protein